MKRLLFALPLLSMFLVSGCIVPVHDRGYHYGHDRDHHRHHGDRHHDHDRRDRDRDDHWR